MNTVYTAEYLEAVDRRLSNLFSSYGDPNRETDINFLSGERARTIYALTRPMNLPKAPLYVPGEKPPKGKSIPLGPIAKRVLELKKRNTTAEAELRALLALRDHAAELEHPVAA